MDQYIDTNPRSDPEDEMDREADREADTPRSPSIGIIQLMGFGLLVFTFLVGVMGIVMVTL